MNGINSLCEVFSFISQGTLVSKPYSSRISSGHSPCCYLAWCQKLSRSCSRLFDWTPESQKASPSTLKQLFQDDERLSCFFCAANKPMLFTASSTLSTWSHQQSLRPLGSLTFLSLAWTEKPLREVPFHLAWHWIILEHALGIVAS